MGPMEWIDVRHGPVRPGVQDECRRIEARRAVNMSVPALATAPAAGADGKGPVPAGFPEPGALVFDYFPMESRMRSISRGTFCPNPIAMPFSMLRSTLPLTQKVSPNWMTVI